MNLLVAILIGVSAHAKQKWEADDPQILRTRIGLSSPGLDFVLQTPGMDYSFTPNVAASPFVDVSFQKLALGIKLPSEPDPGSIQRRGKSSASDYQLRLLGHRTSPEFVFQEFKGFGLEGWTEPSGKEHFRTDIKVTNFSINLIQNLSPAHYSMPVALNQKGIQKEAGGSFLLFTSIGRTAITGDTPLIPVLNQGNSGEVGTIRSVKIYSLVAGGGYGYIQPIIKRFYLTAAVFAGYGIQRNFVDLGLTRRWSTAPAHRIGVRPSIGYNYGAHIATFQIVVDSNTARIIDSQIQQATFTIQLSYAYRFSDVHIPLLERISRILP